MEVSGANGLKHDIEEKALKGLLETFGSVFNLQEISFAYSNAGRNVDLACEILSDKQANNSASTTQFSTAEVRGKESSESSYDNISKNTYCTNGKSKPSKTKWRPVSGGTVSSFIGKDYVKPAQPANAPSQAPKPLKLDSKEFPESQLWGEENKSNPPKDDCLEKDMEDFLFKLLGEGFQLNRDVIREVLDSCGYDMKKSMLKLLDHSAETMDERMKKSSKKCTNMCPTSEGFSCERKLQQLNPSGGNGRGDPSTNKGELLRQPKDRNELQKEVLAALFSAPEKSEELPEKTVKTVRRSIALGQVVTEPPRDFEPEPVTNMVSLQQDNENDADEDEEGSFQALRKAVMEYRVTMKTYWKAAVDAFAKEDHVLAGKLLEEGQFYYEKAREADEESNKKIFETRNRDTKSDVLLDLHEDDARDARRLLKCHLSSLAGIPSLKYLKVIIESNDIDTTKGARRRSVMKLLQRESIQWIEEGTPGTILIPLDTVNPKRLSFAKK
ncbi:hypothetical protein OWV82_023371 [Melia azedarach]|nr:hypothetical protein OWV82_023371 [Melia azedarach]